MSIQNNSTDPSEGKDTSVQLEVSANVDFNNERAATLLKLSTADPHEMEAQIHRHYSCEHAHEKERRDQCYEWWDQVDKDHFDGNLPDVHITESRVAPRSYGEVHPVTDWGAKVQVKINSGMINGEHRSVTASWPDENIQDFIRDVLLHEAIHVDCLVQDGEPWNTLHGARFVETANRIGKELGSIDSVVDRARGSRNAGQPTCCRWPHNVRPPGYYGGAFVWSDGTDAPSVTARASVWQYLQHLIDANQQGRAHQLIHRLAEPQSTKGRANREVEKGTLDHLGNPLPLIRIEPRWVEWWDGLVAKIAWTIHHNRTWDHVLVLHDALIEAGCDNPHVLGHCLQPLSHGQSCWLLNGLIEKGKEREVL